MTALSVFTCTATSFCWRKVDLSNTNTSGAPRSVHLIYRRVPPDQLSTASTSGLTCEAAAEDLVFARAGPGRRRATAAEAGAPSDARVRRHPGRLRGRSRRRAVTA